MEEERRTPPSLEARVTEVLEACDYEVQQAVGLEQGVIDWFATPRSGFIRPRTYFRVLPRSPEDLNETLTELESARVARKADRAVAIVMSERLPSGYAPDLVGRTSNVLTFRRWLLEISGIAEHARQRAQPSKQERRGQTYLPRRGRLADGAVVPLEPFIEAWTDRPDRPVLVIEGPPGSGKQAALDHAIDRAAVRFSHDPEQATLLVDIPYMSLPSVMQLVLDAGAAVPVITRTPFLRAAPMQEERWRWRCLLAASEADTLGLPPPGIGVVRIALVPPSSEEITSWYRERVGSQEPAGQLARARAENDSFCSLSDALPNLGSIVSAVKSIELADRPASIDAWIASVVVAYVDAVKLEERPLPPSRMEGEDALSRHLEDVALEQFAMGLRRSGRIPVPQVLWRRDAQDSLLTWFDVTQVELKNLLLRDYYIARKIAREVSAGNSEILLRYQFPSFVFLFLALVAPEISAQVTQGRVAQLDEKIRSEVERKLQLTFAHLLNRPVGMVRARLREIRDGIDRERATALARSFEQIEEELRFIQSLADRTRLWETAPDEPIEEVAVRPVIEELGRELNARHPAVTLVIDVESSVRVRAMRDALREVMQCLMENAFHATMMRTDDRASCVTAVTRQIGSVIRIEIRDTGCGVPPEDRQRIFEPLVTTKKGGAGKPRGTGLGLPIARRYAEHMHGQVGLDETASETCFYVDLVAWTEGE
ncbi:HAMP domain-containing sensor histidine kinase [Sorangium sp. So ce296]|uniref:sensor histidine kinase n=1 Tax=Sorangium sp. So ce296 TaxID=3133296 RepID=UPI003F635266